jgi:hypothetical protein
MVRLALASALVLLMISGQIATSSQVLDVRLSQRMMSAPGALRVTAFVLKDDANRALTGEYLIRVSLLGAESTIAESEQTAEVFGRSPEAPGW